MSYKTFYFADSNTVMHVGVGGVAGSDLHAAALRVQRILATHLIDRLVVDFSAVETFDVTPEDLQALAEANIRAAKLMPQVRVLIVATSDIVYGMCRMWMVYVQKSGVDIQLFRDRAAALDSLGFLLCPEAGAPVDDVLV